VIDKRGSILIAMIWIVTILSVITISIGVRARMHAKSVAQQSKAIRYQYLADAAVRWAIRSLEADSDMGCDSPDDGWYAIETGADFPDAERADDLFFESLQMRIRDEDSKMNINALSERMLSDVCAIIEQAEEAFASDVEDLVDDVLQFREARASKTQGVSVRRFGGFLSMDEFLRLKHCNPNDISILKKYFTIYPLRNASLRVNINTASDFVLEALIAQLAAETDNKKDLYNALVRKRRGESDDGVRFFTKEAMQYAAFLEAIDLPKDAAYVSLTAQLLRYVTVDSRYFTVTIATPDGRYAWSAVVGPEHAQQGSSGLINASASSEYVLLDMRRLR
jgi:type II secretory pathway component PulK